MASIGRASTVRPLLVTVSHTPSPGVASVPSEVELTTYVLITEYVRETRSSDAWRSSGVLVRDAQPALDLRVGK